MLEEILSGGPGLQIDHRPGIIYVSLLVLNAPRDHRTVAQPIELSVRTRTRGWRIVTQRKGILYSDRAYLCSRYETAGSCPA